MGLRRVCVVAAWFVMHTTVTVRGSVMCGEDHCDVFEWCEQLSIKCMSCADSCDENSQMHSIHQCRLKCADYLQHQFNQQMNSSAIAARTDLQLLKRRVRTLTSVVIIVSCALLVLLLHVIYTVVISRRCCRRKERILGSEAPITSLPYTTDITPRHNTDHHKRFSIIQWHRKTSPTSANNKRSDEKRRGESVVNFANSAGDSSIVIKNLRVPSEDACPQDEGEAIYANLAFTASPSVSPEPKMPTRSLPRVPDDATKSESKQRHREGGGPQEVDITDNHHTTSDQHTSDHPSR